MITLASQAGQNMGSGVAILFIAILLIIAGSGGKK